MSYEVAIPAENSASAPWRAITSSQQRRVARPWGQTSSRQKRVAVTQNNAPVLRRLRQRQPNGRGKRWIVECTFRFSCALGPQSCTTRLHTCCRATHWETQPSQFHGASLDFSAQCNAFAPSLTLLLLTCRCDPMTDHEARAPSRASVRAHEAMHESQLKGEQAATAMKSGSRVSNTQREY
jgi:hypothetical protein